MNLPLFNSYCVITIDEMNKTYFVWWNSGLFFCLPNLLTVISDKMLYYLFFSKDVYSKWESKNPFQRKQQGRSISRSQSDVTSSAVGREAWRNKFGNVGPPPQRHQKSRYRNTRGNAPSLLNLVSRIVYILAVTLTCCASLPPIFSVYSQLL